MKSSRSQEGWMFVDNRNSPGIPEKVLHDHNLPTNMGRGLFEAPTYTCSHCQRVVVINTLRNRERTYCRKCNHYICDECGVKYALTKECKTFKQIIDEHLESRIIIP